MKPPYTPRELVLMTALVFMTCVALFVAYQHHKLFKLLDGATIVLKAK